MIFARDKAQMCNNLLQYAHVYAWGREHGRKVISMRFSYKYQYFHICHTNLTGFGWYLLAKYLAALKLLPTANFKHAECDHHALEQKMLRHRHVVVSGWYVRYYDLFLKYRDEICDLFRIDKQYTESVRKEMAQWKGVKLGVHIRRGDYAIWKDGIYFYSDKQYATAINQFTSLMPNKIIDIYLSTNDTEVSQKKYEQMIDNERVRVHLLGGSPVEDLFMLSECDFIIGPPSTFSLVAAMYRDIPLCRMDMVKLDQFSLSDFRLFDYWFRNLV
ncbi:MAG: alpha-1,2-fucosyltransferase [Prevotella sp.]|nr:alpha-1,2-fucosyltransferase [Prevotella sp.]